MPRQISVHFLPEFTHRLESFDKVSTTRYHRLGHVGDFFNWNGHFYTIEIIRKHHLWFVAKHHFDQEGFISEQAFIDWWSHHYQEKGYHPHHQVFYHRFFKET